MKYDVMVVGAGPAGSATARDIARAGLNVLIIEKRETVGHPVFCSGLVTPRALEVAGVSDGLVLNRIKGAIVRSASGKRLNLGGDKVYALAIDRAGLDAALLRQAEEAGAHLLLDANLFRIEKEDHALRLFINRNGRIDQLVTRLLIGADGVGSLVGQWIGVHDSDSVVTAIAGEAWLDGGEPDRAEVFVGSSVAPGWFGWIIPLGDGKVRIGTGNGNHTHIAVRQLFNAMLEAFPARFKGLKIDRLWGKGIPLYSPVKSYAENVLLVGDAARQVKPTSGGGIYSGLVAAKHCASIAVEALKRESFSESFLSRYQAGWMGKLGEELERSLDLRRIFLTLSDREMDKLLDLLGNPFLQKLLSRFGDIDYPSRTVVEIVRATPVLRTFLHMGTRFDLC